MYETGRVSHRCIAEIDSAIRPRLSFDVEMAWGHLAPIVDQESTSLVSGVLQRLGQKRHRFISAFTLDAQHRHVVHCPQPGAVDEMSFLQETIAALGRPFENWLLSEVGWVAGTPLNSASTNPRPSGEYSPTSLCYTSIKRSPSKL